MTWELVVFLATYRAQAAWASGCVCEPLERTKRGLKGGGRDTFHRPGHVVFVQVTMAPRCLILKNHLARNSHEIVDGVLETRLHGELDIVLTGSRLEGNPSWKCDIPTQAVLAHALHRCRLMCHLVQCGNVIGDVHVDATGGYWTTRLVCVVVEHDICWTDIGTAAAGTRIRISK